MISIVVAVAKNGVIGNNGKIPWHLKGEQLRIKEITMGHPLIMGRKTHESIGRALPDRTNIVITSDTRYASAGCVIVNSFDDAIKVARNAHGANEIFIMGGQKVFEMAMPIADRLYLTKVDASPEGDTFFRFDPAAWQQTKSLKVSAGEDIDYDYEFIILERKATSV